MSDLQWEEIDRIDYETNADGEQRVPYVIIEKAPFDGAWLIRTTVYTWNGSIMNCTTTVDRPAPTYR